MANIFGGGMGWELASTDDPLYAGFISATAARGEELVNELIARLARAIRNEIADALNKGGKSGAGTE
jgi:hypothetical protein